MIENRIRYFQREEDPLPSSRALPDRGWRPTGAGVGLVKLRKRRRAHTHTHTHRELARGLDLTQPFPLGRLPFGLRFDRCLRHQQKQFGAFGFGVFRYSNNYIDVGSTCILGCSCESDCYAARSSPRLLTRPGPCWRSAFDPAGAGRGEDLAGPGGSPASGRDDRGRAAALGRGAPPPRGWAGRHDSEPPGLASCVVPGLRMSHSRHTPARTMSPISEHRKRRGSKRAVSMTFLFCFRVYDLQTTTRLDDPFNLQ